jgi:hypothetical protein
MNLLKRFKKPASRGKTVKLLAKSIGRGKKLKSAGIFLRGVGIGIGGASAARGEGMLKSVVWGAIPIVAGSSLGHFGKRKTNQVLQKCIGHPLLARRLFRELREQGYSHKFLTTESPYRFLKPLGLLDDLTHEEKRLLRDFFNEKKLFHSQQKKVNEMLKL